MAGGATSENIGKEERFVIFASSLGTVFEWYDFFLYATLAPFFAALFFPPGNEMAALMSAFATYAAGFLVRPFGALVFGRIGDMAGRKYAFLVTIIVMGAATFAVGLLPTFASIGWWAPILLVTLRLLQGLALGGEYGGAATYVAEHSAPQRRGFTTSFIQMTATIGFFLALLIIGLCRIFMEAAVFTDWGWRLPFLVSLILLLFSVIIRLRLNESPVFQQMQSEGRASKNPLTESFLRYPNNKFAALALFGATAGQGVVWYTGQFYALFFIQITLKLDFLLAYALIGASLLFGSPMLIFFGWLSDRIGRLKIIMAGCLLAALCYFPLFSALTQAVNPDLAAFHTSQTITVSADATQCRLHIFVGPWSEFSDCDRAQDFVAKLGVSFTRQDTPGQPVSLSIGETRIEGWDAAKWQAAFTAGGLPARADPAKVDWIMAELILLAMLAFVGMVYGPIAAYLVELFPAKIRYTSMSLPYHIGNGWFGGMLPLLATAIVAATGNIYNGLWYPIGVALMTCITGMAFLHETKNVDISH